MQLQALASWRNSSLASVKRRHSSNTQNASTNAPSGTASSISIVAEQDRVTSHTRSAPPQTRCVTHLAEVIAASCCRQWLKGPKSGSFSQLIEEFSYSAPLRLAAPTLGIARQILATAHRIVQRRHFRVDIGGERLLCDVRLRQLPGRADDGLALEDL